MLQMQMASKEDFPDIKNFYVRIIKAMENAEYNPAWIIDVYPNDEYLKQAISNNEMLIGKWDDELISAMVINNKYNEGFNKASWTVEAKPEEVTVIHTFGVMPSMQGKGIGRQMMDKAMEIARNNHQKVVRLDVLGGNLPPARFYEKCGFKYVGTVDLFYEDTGVTDFMLYEYVL